MLAMTIMVAATGFFAISFLSIPSAEVFSRNQLAGAVLLSPADEAVLDELPARVAVVRSDKASAADIGYAEIESMIRQAVLAAGGCKKCRDRSDATQDLRLQ